MKALLLSLLLALPVQAKSVWEVPTPRPDNVPLPKVCNGHGHGRRIPEPATVALLGFGFLMLIRKRRY